MGSCSGPSDPTQTVSFVLDLDAKRLSRIEFVVRYESGDFVGDDGNCEVSSAASALQAVFSPVREITVGARVLPPLGGGSTTSTSPTSSTTTTTDTPPTTTTSTTSTTSTTGEPPLACTLTFRLDDAVTLGALQYLTDYSNAPGFLSGSGGDVQCSGLAGLPAFNDCDAGNNDPSCTTELKETLNSAFIALAPGITGPVDIAECIFQAFVVPQSSDFSITVIEATTPGGTGVVPLPDVSISSIECNGPTTTTMAGPTTTLAPPTTLPGDGSCGDGNIDSGEDCDDGNTESDDGCDSDCDAEFDFSAVDTGGQLTIRLLNGNGIAPGTTLARCRFQGDIEEADLEITTTDCGLASGSNCNPSADADVTESTSTTTTTTTTTSTTLADGADCSSSGQCKSGFCVDEVCCDRPCLALCESCLGEDTGGSDGDCEFITIGSDPDDECAGNSTCAGAGTCSF